MDGASENERDGDLKAVATRALELYGSEIFGLLIASLRDEQQAREVYSRFTLDLWLGLPGFKWKSSLRTWLYILARNAAHRHRIDPFRKRRQSISRLDEVGGPGEPVERRRTTTAWFRRSEIKSEVQKLRDSLTPDEATLLILRVDRQMSWSDIASIMFEVEARDVASKAALLRKRYERICGKLRKLAEQRGLLDRSRGAA